MYRSCLLLALSSLFTHSLVAQEKPLIDQKFYVVIGAFAIPHNAIEFAENARKLNYPAEYVLNSTRKLFYVYVMSSEDRHLAVNETVRLQKHSPYPDTWLCSGLLGGNPQLLKITEAERTEAIQELEGDKKTEEMMATDTKTEKAADKDETVKPVEADSSAVEEMAGTKPFLFSITSLENGDTLAGDVDIFDADDITENRKSGTYRGNDWVKVKPANKSGNLLLECEVFGYRKLQLPLNYNTPEATDGVIVAADQVTVPFHMVRLKKGDKNIGFSVYFYKDAAIMRPESRFEVNSLVKMLQENPTYKIRLHGHTNGNSAGKIISMGNSKNFFELNSGNKSGRGSARKLSEERAMLIRRYLIENGIDSARTEVMAWGGNQPVYEVNHIYAQANVRVEIEILED